MICPTCRQFNPAEAKFCSYCRTQLSPASNGSSAPSPFEDFLPQWMQPGAAANTPAVPAAPRPSNPSQSGPSSFSDLGFSLDDLLQATEAANGPTTPPASTMSAPNWTNTAPAYTPPPPPSTPAILSVDDLLSNNKSSASATASIPMPSFQEPPAWGQSAAQGQPQSWGIHDAGPSARPFVPGDMPVRERKERPVAGESYGVERGFYYYTDQEGQLVLHELAGFFRRFFAAVIDYVVTILIGFLYTITIGQILSALLLGNSSDALDSALRSNNTAAINDAMKNYLSIGYLAESLISLTIPMFYYIMLVGLAGSTIGHKAMGLKVVGKSGPVRIYGATVRALYGSIAGIVAIFFIPNLLNSVFALNGNNNSAAARAFLNQTTTFLLVLGLLEFAVVLGFLWALVDPKHQGLHDKFAGTMVVRSDPA